MQSASDVSLVSYGQIFTLLFVTFGPLKIVGPFVHLTREADEAGMRRIAVRSFLIAMGAAVVGGFAGRALITSWSISVSAVLLSGGIIFMLVGLNVLLEQYQPAHAPPPPLPPEPMAAAMRITFPIRRDAVRHRAPSLSCWPTAPMRSAQPRPCLILLAVMVLNLLAMVYSRRIQMNIING
jgi:small neutral amino acid transporter SnatA (MarC family)